MEEWKEYKLGEITNMKNGKKRPHNNGVFPVYGGNGIMDYSDTYNAENAIIVGRVGAYCGCVYKCDGKCWVSDNAISVSAKEIVDIHFLYYLMTSLDFHHHHIGGAQPLMTQDIIGDFTVSIPPMPVQHQIVQILKSLDDKIEMNRRINDNFYYQKLLEIIYIWMITSLINDNLEQQAQTLFKSWFVDFEPFKDGGFEETEQGMIPKGWKAGSLEDITTQKAERVGEREDVKVLSPVTTGQLMLSEEYFTKQVFSESIAKYKVVEKGDFAYNPARVSIGSLGRNNYDFDGCVSPVYVVFSCKDGYAYLFDLYRKTEKFKTEVNLRAIGGVRQSLNYKDFAFIQCIIPPLYVVEEFNAIYDHLLVMQRHTGEECDRLAQLRDTLLPRLMTGELKVNEIENAI